MSRNHDAQFDAVGRRAFCGGLRRHGYSYTALAAELERAGLPRPSAGSAAYRAMILHAAALLPNAEPWELCDRIAPLFDARHHLGAALPQEDDGYLAALCDDIPSLCAAPDAPSHTTHCDGMRVGGFACMRAVIPAPSCCDELEAA